MFDLTFNVDLNPHETYNLMINNIIMSPQNTAFGSKSCCCCCCFFACLSVYFSESLNLLFFRRKVGWSSLLRIMKMVTFIPIILTIHTMVTLNTFTIVDHQEDCPLTAILNLSNLSHLSRWNTHTANYSYFVDILFHKLRLWAKSQCNFVLKL